ncbi:MAG: PAS domain-containing protein, partial [Alphaproteobacteria bacterium]
METTITRVRAGGRAHSPADSATILDLLPAPVVTLDAEERITMVNAAAENFFIASAAHLIDRPLSNFVPPDSPLHGLITQVRRTNAQVSEHELAIESPRVGRHFLSVQATPLPDSPGFIVVMMFDRGITEMIDRQMTHRGAAR